MCVRWLIAGIPIVVGIGAWLLGNDSGYREGYAAGERNGKIRGRWEALTKNSRWWSM